MASLLDDEQRPTSLIGGGDVSPLLIQQPDPDRPTQGEAVVDTYNRINAYRQEQMRQAQDAGLWEGGEVWEGGHPTSKGLSDVGQQYVGGLLFGTTAPGLTAYHGSPHSFDAFDIGKIGTGEGAQAYGHGLY